MTCADFCTKTRSIINPRGLNLNQNGCVINVYFGSALPVVFHNQWAANDLCSLVLLQDLRAWENSHQYVAAHHFKTANGTPCVSLSATNDLQYDKDVVDVVLTADNVEIRGVAREP